MKTENEFTDTIKKPMLNKLSSEYCKLNHLECKYTLSRR